MKLNLGCGRNIMEGWTNVDHVAGPGVDVVADLDACWSGPEPCRLLPFAENSVDEILMSHVIEHLRNPLPLMQELHYVAKPGATVTIRCPHGASDDADDDPTHVRRMYPGSFGYFGQPYYWRADYGYRGDWEIDAMYLWLHPRMERESVMDKFNMLERERNVVREIVVVMHAVKPIREPLRRLQRFVTPILHIASY